MAAVTTKVNVHLADNVPYRQHDREVITDVGIRLTGNPSFLALRKEGTKLASVYEMRIADLGLLGLAAEAADAAISSALVDLVLALNLHVPRAVFSQVDVSPHGFRIARDAAGEPPLVETDAGGHVTVRASERIRITDYVKVTLTTTVDIDQGELLDVVRRVRAFRASSTPSSDLARAMARFTEGCRSLDRLAIVTHHAAATELAANAGRPANQHLTGEALLREAASLSGFTETSVRAIWFVYNRSKHADRRPEDQRAYESALQDIARLAGDAKLVAGAVLLSKLPAG